MGSNWTIGSWNRLERSGCLLRQSDGRVYVRLSPRRESEPSLLARDHPRDVLARGPDDLHEEGIARPDLVRSPERRPQLPACLLELAR